MDKNMKIAVDEFIMARINALGDNPPKPLSTAFSAFYNNAGELKAALSEQQQVLYRHCEDSYSLLEGETQYAYYRAGFSDAVDFLMGWRDKAWSWNTV